jgi:tetratricopeptide (TPR) repeat protein
MKAGDNDITLLSKEAYALLKQGLPKEALEIFLDILQMDECNNYALVGAGDAYRKLGSFDTANECYEACLAKHPTNSFALFGLADTFRAREDYGKAIEVWEQYLEQDSGNLAVLTRLADAHRKLHDYKSSRERYLEVLATDENNPYAIIGLGHLHYEFKEYRDALYYWEKMTDSSRGRIDKRVLTSIGNCYRKLKQFADGIPFFEKALSMEKSNFYSLFGLGDCYRGLNKSEKSLEYWNRILEQDPRNKMILTRAGDAYCVTKQYDAAKDYYNRALAIDYDIFAVLGLAVIAKIEGRIDDAIASLETLVQQDPKNYRPYVVLAECYLEKNEKVKAVDTLMRFQEQCIKNQKVLSFLEELRGHGFGASVDGNHEAEPGR